jgi:hypothetical protein
MKNTALLTIDSTKVTVPANLTALEDALYGTAGSAPRLPLPDEVILMFAGAQTVVTPLAPTATTAGVITINATTGVVYRRSDTNAIVSGTTTIATLSQTVGITAYPASGAYRIAALADTYWPFTKTV